MVATHQRLKKKKNQSALALTTLLGLKPTGIRAAFFVLSCVARRCSPWPAATLNVFCLSDCLSHRRLFGCYIFYTHWPVSPPPPLPLSLSPFSTPPCLTVSPLGLAVLPPHPSFFQLSLLHPSFFIAASCCSLYFPPVRSPAPPALIPSHPPLFFCLPFFFLPRCSFLKPMPFFKHYFSLQMKMLVMSMAVRLEEIEAGLQEWCDEASMMDVDGRRPLSVGALTWCLTHRFNIPISLRLHLYQCLLRLSFISLPPKYLFVLASPCA